MKKAINRPTIEQVAESLAAWLELYGPELMRRRQEKLTAQAATSQAIRRSNGGYVRLEVLGLVAILLGYLLAGSIGPTHWTPNGTVAEGSNYHAF